MVSQIHFWPTPPELVNKSSFGKRFFVEENKLRFSRRDNLRLYRRVMNLMTSVLKEKDRRHMSAQTEDMSTETGEETGAHGDRRDVAMKPIVR